MCVRDLLTPVGLRTLAPGDPAYAGVTAATAARDAAYHQGTVWPWLLGPFVQAHLNVYDDPVLSAHQPHPAHPNPKHFAVDVLGVVAAEPGDQRRDMGGAESRNRPA